jgi:hypothetical protein
MDVREKLVELIESARYWGSNTSEEIADNLIENGVTAQELDGCEYCNAFTEEDINGFFLPTTDPDCECAMVTIKFCPMCGRRLPQPPKGE